jgi:two-component system sensor histidine kinase YesM
LLEYPDSLAYIIDNNGVIYSCSDKSKLGTKVDNAILELKTSNDVTKAEINNQTYFVISKKLNDLGMTFVVGFPQKQILAKLSDSVRSCLVITLFIALLIAASILLSLWVTKFFKNLLNNINKIKAGDYSGKMPVYKDAELNLLSETFNNMTDEIEYLINQVYEKQLLLKDTELKFLQSQMNPHFLLNTLVTIGYKARLSNDDTVYRMVASLTELLQASLYTNGTEKITIRQEIEFVKFYLYLQKIRFEDKIEYHINISDDSVLEYYLPKLCLQPIVENAVVHGLENKIGKGTVDIYVREEADSVYFEVCDDGIGFEADNWAKAQGETAANRKNGHNRIGLYNTNQRLKIIYGNKYGITVESKKNLGSRVIIHIPADRGENKNVQCYDCG